MALPNPFKSISIDPERVHSALEGAGMTGVTKEVLNGTLVQYTGQFQGKPFMLKVFLNKNGRCTLGKATGNDEEAFQTLAAIVARECGYGGSARLEKSIPRFPAPRVLELFDYLQSMRAVIEVEENGGSYRLTRFRGPRGDRLTVKHFDNETLQLQGTHAQVAVWTLDFLRSVLPLDAVLEQQVAIYRLPLTVDSIKDELSARIPNAEPSLADEVRVQLSSALALTKVGIQLEDYAALAFPALRGLEGYCIQLLREECRFDPPRRAELGNYFERTGATFALAPVYRDSVASWQHAAVSECYTMWQSQRHRLFHMDGTLETSAILEDREVAVALVEQVLSLIDRTYAVVLKNRI